MKFLHPEWFLLVVPLIIILFYRRRSLSHTTILFPNVAALKHISHRRTVILSRAAWVCRLLTIVCVIIALSQPRGIFVEKEVSSQGIDIMIALDVSGSMAAEDFKPNNRLTVAKETIKTFIRKRHSDRIGLVVFGGSAYTQCPKTLDYDILSTLLDDITLEGAGQGTAIGMAIATALNRLKDSDANSKVIMLLTDGENNRGEISPLRAATLAQDLGIKIYTIGIGKEGGASIPYIDPSSGKKMYSQEKTYLNEDTLSKIAKTTKGNYFRAVDKQTLQNILEKINTLETSEIKSMYYELYDEWFPYFITAALIMIILELLLSHLIAVKVP